MQQTDVGILSQAWLCLALPAVGRCGGMVLVVLVVAAAVGWSSPVPVKVMI